ncbi:MAG: hypothetical protein ACP5QU_00055 [Anaerolineae bacterium]
MSTNYILEIKCWNCGKTTTLEEGQVAQAIKHMDETKLDFYDVPCPFCEKANRTKKEVFVQAYVNRKETAHAVSKAKKEKREND